MTPSSESLQTPAWEELLEEVLVFAQHDEYQRCPGGKPDLADFCTCGLRAAVEDLKTRLRIMQSVADSGCELITEMRSTLGLERGELLTSAVATLKAARRPND